MSNCIHDNGEYCEMLSDKEVRQPCLETPLCEDYKGIVRCKDCKYWEDGYCDDSLIEGLERKVSRFEDDFCSRGKLK